MDNEMMFQKTPEDMTVRELVDTVKQLRLSAQVPDPKLYKGDIFTHKRSGRQWILAIDGPALYILELDKVVRVLTPLR